MFPSTDNNRMMTIHTKGFVCMNFKKMTFKRKAALTHKHAVNIAYNTLLCSKKYIF